MRPLLALLSVLAAAVLVFVLTADGPTPVANASFHEMRIYAVMGGAGGDDSVQFVELRQAAGGQNQVQNGQLCFYDEGGFPWARFVFPDKADSGADQSSILIGTSAMAAAWNAGADAEPDFIFSASNTTVLDQGGLADVNAPIAVPNGNIVYESKADGDCGGPNPIDSIAYGSGYTGVSLIGDPQAVFDTDLPTNGDGFRLKTTPVTFPPTDNSTEYEVATCIVARNNAGQQGTVGDACAPAETPTPVGTPTPTASPEPSGTPTATPEPSPSFTDAPPLQGDADCSGTVNIGDADIVVRDAADVEDVGCSDRADVDCDESVDLLDALALFKYVAGLATSAPPCPGIGGPLIN